MRSRCFGCGCAARVSVNLSLTGAVNLTLDDLSSNPQAFPINTKFSLINYTDTWNSGVFTYNSLTLANGTQFTAGLNTWLITYNDATGGVNFSNEYVGGHFVNLTAVVPETGVAVLGGIGLLTLLRRRRIA